MFLINKIGHISGCSDAIKLIQPIRKHKQDICKARNIEKSDKQPMKRKRRHTTDMEDILADDEDRSISETPNGFKSGLKSSIPQKGPLHTENSSELLNRQFSQMHLQDKPRKSKRHCTR